MKADPNGSEEKKALEFLHAGNEATKAQQYALGHFEKAIGCFDKLKLKHPLADAYHAAGNAQHGLGHFLKAVESYQHELILRMEMDDVLGIAKTYNNMGIMYANLHR